MVPPDWLEERLEATTATANQRFCGVILVAAQLQIQILAKFRVFFLAKFWNYEIFVYLILGGTGS